MANICIIPARGGSKGLEQKNIRRLGGVSLLRRLALKAVKSAVFDEVILSTDDDRYYSEVDDLPVELEVRPSSLAGDNVTLALVMQHIAELRKDNIEEHSVFFSLQPTSPFLSIDSIVEAVRLINFDRDVTGVLSITEVQDHPWIAISENIFDGDKIAWSVPEVSKRFPRQVRPQMFRPAGCLYGRRLKQALSYDGTGYSLGKSPRALRISALESMDINTYEDLQIAEALNEVLFNEEK